jgi:dynein heavy chain 2
VTQKAGIEGEQVVFIVEDYQMIEPQFIELINSLLAAGEVPGLYTPEELDPLIGPLRDLASQDSHSGTMYSYFAKRRRIKLKILHCKYNNRSKNQCTRSNDNGQWQRNV